MIERFGVFLQWDFDVMPRVSEGLGKVSAAVGPEQQSALENRGQTVKAALFDDALLLSMENKYAL